MAIKFSVARPVGIGRLIPQPITNIFLHAGKGLFGTAPKPKPQPKPVGFAGIKPVHRVF